MAGTETVAQLLRQQLLLRQGRNQLDAFGLGAGLGAGFGAGLGAGLGGRPMSNASTAQRVFFTVFVPSSLEGKIKRVALIRRICIPLTRLK